MIVPPTIQRTFVFTRLLGVLELLETRPQRSSELLESVRAEQDQHDDQDHEQFLRPKSKHH